MPDRMLEDMPDRMPEGMPNKMPDKMSDRMPEDMPDKVPECLRDRMPEDLPDYMPEDMPDRMPEDMPEHMPEDMPGRMPEDMPDRMPEDMSDRMPEDLPVTKRINVMMGTTRSKVIFYICFFVEMVVQDEQSVKKSKHILYICDIPRLDCRSICRKFIFELKNNTDCFPQHRSTVNVQLNHIFEISGSLFRVVNLWCSFSRVGMPGDLVYAEQFTPHPHERIWFHQCQCQIDEYQVE